MNIHNIHKSIFEGGTCGHEYWNWDFFVQLTCKLTPTQQIYMHTESLSEAVERYTISKFGESKKCDFQSVVACLYFFMQQGQHSRGLGVAYIYCYNHTLQLSQSSAILTYCVDTTCTVSVTARSCFSIIKKFGWPFVVTACTHSNMSLNSRLDSPPPHLHPWACTATTDCTLRVWKTIKFQQNNF